VVLLSVSVVRTQQDVQRAGRELAELRGAAEQTAQRLAKEEAALQQERAARAALEQELSRSRQPQAGLLVLSLNRTRGAAASAATLRLTSSAQWFVISVDREEPARFDVYRATLLGADGGQVWRGDGLKPASKDQLAIAFHSSLLNGGDYRLVVEGMDRAGRPQPMAQHALRVIGP
jgi:hypothetical protein